jgi:outer membrane protein insertion porin family
LTGPNSLEGIVTSKVLPSLTSNTLDSAYSPHHGTQIFLGGEIAGLGGTVKTIRPIVQYKHFIPMQKGRNALGFNLQASFLTGYGGVVAPPFERFYLGGENDLRGFDIRSISPVTFLPTTLNIKLTNPDGSVVPLDPKNPRAGGCGVPPCPYTIPIPLQRIVFPGGDTSLTGNLEYRVTIAGPVALAPFVDLGVNPIIRESQLTLNGGELNLINQTLYGCPSRDVALNCVGGQSIAFSGILSPVSGTNWVPRMSTGLELQVFLPIINAPFRIYYAYNPLRLDTSATAPVPITRSMFPDTDAGQFTYDQAIRVSAPTYRLREPRKTFRFTVATTF